MLRQICRAATAMRPMLMLPLVLSIPLLAACGSKPWLKDPQVRAAREDCASLSEGERYACTERHAVETLNPDVCRLAGIWVDDMCLQAVYQAANDPSICERLYLEGVRPTCRAYYATSGTAIPGGTLFRSDQVHLDVSLPAGWAAAEGPEILARPFTGLVAFNSWGETDFWAPEVKTASGATYGPQSTLGQLPTGGAYVVLVDFGGGPPRPADAYGPEYDRQDVSGIWESQDCREGSGATWVDFCKWGRFLRLEVYCQPDASDETAAALNALIGRWQFDQVPVGDAGWAVVEARSLLPATTNPSGFPLIAGQPAGHEPLQSSVADEHATRVTEAVVQGDTVQVTFSYRWNEPPLGLNDDGCPPDRCHWWRFEARPSGDVVLVEQGGSPIPAPGTEDGWLQYGEPTLGFSVDLPQHWGIAGPRQGTDPRGHPEWVVEFTSELHPYGHEAFNRYGIRVHMQASTSGSLSETVESNLSLLLPEFRDQVQVHCCLTVGGEPAVELVDFPYTRWGNRQIVILHDSREYRLDLYPQAGLTTSTPAGIEAMAAFDRFLGTFAFHPTTITPPSPTPTITPAPTPTSAP
jgi:hypothetical protein